MRNVTPAAADGWRGRWPPGAFPRHHRRQGSGAAHGGDVDANGWGELREDRLYQIVRQNGAITDHTVSISFGRPSVRADAMGDAEAIGVNRSLSGISHYLAGDQRQARADLDLSLAHCPMLSRYRILSYGFDHGHRTTIALARTPWLSGQADRAMALTRQIITPAIREDHPVTYCIALIWALSLHLWREDFSAAQEALADFTACAQDNALGPYITAARGLQAELVIHQGESGGAVAALEQSLGQLRASRYELLATRFSIALARGLLLDGRPHDAAQAIDHAIARCAAAGESFALPEMLCLKAEVIRSANTDAAGSVSLLQHALAISQQQGARAWCLRVAAPLASQQADQGQHDAAAVQLKQVLAEMSGAASPADLLRVKELLDSQEL